MAVRQVVVSDISGTDIPENAHARIVITDHPALRGSPVELDVTAEEAERFQTSKIDLVTMEIYAPGERRRHVALEAGVLRELFADFDALVERARPVAGSSPSAARTSGRSGGSRRAKIDYGSAEHAGSLHRGRVTVGRGRIRARAPRRGQRSSGRQRRACDRPQRPQGKGPLRPLSAAAFRSTGGCATPVHNSVVRASDSTSMRSSLPWKRLPNDSKVTDGENSAAP